MFRPTKTNKQFDAFSGVTCMLEGKSYGQYSDPKAWHNQFRKNVFNLIDEGLFKELFVEDSGAPNASIRRMLSMQIIKEGMGWSDSQLFEQCRFNVLVRSAIGLLNLNDPLLGESTYYLFRQRVREYEEKSGINLIEETFAGITSQHVKAYDVNGKSIRMDSKLIGSNIAFCSRYELIHETVSMFYKSLSKHESKHIDRKSRELLESLVSEKGNKVVYRSTSKEVEENLQALGMLIWKLLAMFSTESSSVYNTMQKVFHEQYKIEEGEAIVLRDKKTISAESVQSPHDPDCNYRSKGNQIVKGYSENITETCDKGSLNLITNVQLDVATVADNSFVIPAIVETEQVLVHSVEKVHTDGAYHSIENEAYCNKNDIELILTAMQGAQGRYDLEMQDKGLTVTDTRTGEEIQATQIKSGNWKIKTESGVRYFKPEQIAASELRRQIAQIPVSEKNIRNNVEATIFQASWTLRNNKTRYRGLFKNRIWAYLRCLWINFVRICNHIANIDGKLNGFAKKMAQYVSLGNLSQHFLVKTQVIFLLWIFFPDLLRGSEKL